jgi:hypothetical protein
LVSSATFWNLAYCSIIVVTIPRNLADQLIPSRYIRFNRILLPMSLIIHLFLPDRHPWPLQSKDLRLVRRENGMTPRQRVSLHPPLKRVLGQHLAHPAANVGRLGVPLEIAVRDAKALVELVRVELVGREDAERGRVELDNLLEVRADAMLSAGLYGDGASLL